MRSGRRSVPEVTVNLTPLIDVVFLLLIFFMVSTTFSEETRLNVKLPEASMGVSEPQEQEILLAISEDGTYTVAGKAVDGRNLAMLQAAIKRHAGNDKTRPLLLFADARAPHAAVVTAMEAAASLGFSRLRIATRAPDAGS